MVGTFFILNFSTRTGRFFRVNIHCSSDYLQLKCSFFFVMYSWYSYVQVEPDPLGLSPAFFKVQVSNRISYQLLRACALRQH